MWFWEFYDVLRHIFLCTDWKSKDGHAKNVSLYEKHDSHRKWPSILGAKNVDCSFHTSNDAF